MKNERTGPLSAAVISLLRPLVRILLRRGIPYRAFADLAKRVYVELASGEFGIPGRKPSNSRVSIITGLSRKEVQRVKALQRPSDAAAVARYHRAARVISGWLRDPRFANGEQDPTPLPREGDRRSFAELVRLHGGDVPVRAVLDELLRVGAVALLEDDRVGLVHRAYVPRAGEAEKLAILGTDVGDLISTVDHNLQGGAREPFFQRKVAYDNVPADSAESLRGLAAGKGQTLLEELDRVFSRRDRDVNPKAKGAGRKRVMVGVYYYEEDVASRPSPGQQEKKDKATATTADSAPAS